MALHRSDNERLRAIAEGLAAEDPDYVERLASYSSAIAENPHAPQKAAGVGDDVLRAFYALMWASAVLAGALLILIPAVTAGAG
ncbi:MAG: hypothetical protein M0026_07865 [Nocardiopsaceae bacterium]|nr:hypothetical protein [Nocardiopsaceae bacterium]